MPCLVQVKRAMGTSPGQSWRGSSLRGSSSNAGGGGVPAAQARSRLARVLNAAVVLCCVSYLLYVCLLALDPRTLLAGSHSAYRLRVHVRGNSGQHSPVVQRLHLFRSREQLLQQGEAVVQPAVLPGSNQAPSLKNDVEHSPDKMPADPLAIVAEADAQSKAAKHIIGDEEVSDEALPTEQHQQQNEEEELQGQRSDADDEEDVEERSVEQE